MSAWHRALIFRERDVKNSIAKIIKGNRLTILKWDGET
jgi:hypothetical protein